MKVYRLETKDGIGVFRFFEENLNKYFPSCKRRPSPSIKLIKYNGCFAFDSLEQISQWFDKEELIPVWNVIKISVYEIQDYVSDKNQLVFNKETATLLERLDLGTIFEND